MKSEGVDRCIQTLADAIEFQKSYLAALVENGRSKPAGIIKSELSMEQSWAVVIAARAQGMLDGLPQLRAFWTQYDKLHSDSIYRTGYYAWPQVAMALGKIIVKESDYPQSLQNDADKATICEHTIDTIQAISAAMKQVLAELESFSRRLTDPTARRARQIADEINELGNQIDVQWVRQRCGELVLEAMKLGVFDCEGDAKARGYLWAVYKQRDDVNPNRADGKWDWKSSLFVEAINQLAINTPPYNDSNGKSNDSERCQAGYSQVAAAIRSRASILGSEDGKHEAVERATRPTETVDPPDPPKQFNTGNKGRTVSQDEHQNRKAAAARYQQFKETYQGLGYSKDSYRNAAEWMLDEYDDMDWLTEDLSDDSVDDYALLGKRLAKEIRAYRATPNPRMTSRNNS